MTRAFDPSRDWASELLEARALVLQVRVLAADVEDFLSRSTVDVAPAAKAVRRLSLVEAALARMIARAERELAKLGRLP